MLITLVSRNVNNCFLFRKRCGVACKQDGVVLVRLLVAPIAASIAAKLKTFQDNCINEK